MNSCAEIILIFETPKTILDPPAELLSIVGFLFQQPRTPCGGGHQQPLFKWKRTNLGKLAFLPSLCGYKNTISGIEGRGAVYA